MGCSSCDTAIMLKMNAMVKNRIFFIATKINDSTLSLDFKSKILLSKNALVA
jgi:hypothetical protein